MDIRKIINLLESVENDIQLNEYRAQEIVHKNPTISALKALARNNRFHSCRFVIYKDGTVVAADSENFTHNSMAPAMGAWEVKGYVQYMGNDDYTYRSMEPYSAINKYHPILKHWERSGIEDGNSDVVEENLNDSKIQAHREGSTMWLDYFEVPQRGIGLGTREYQRWEQNLPADIKTIRLHASDVGYGPSHGFWDQMGFDYESPDDDNYMIKRIDRNRTNRVNENFADGKGPGKPGDSQRHGIPKNATMAQLQKAAKAPGRKGQLARWQINMRHGHSKK